MPYNLLHHSIQTLKDNLMNGTQEGNFLFYKFLELMTDRNSGIYILHDLELLTEVLDELRFKELIDAIALYDAKAAMQLDVLIK